MKKITISGREISNQQPPLVIAEVGINHNGSLIEAKKMVDAAYVVGCECIKFQSHVIEDEMSERAKKVIPGNADKSIWEIMEGCALTEVEEIELKAYVESKGIIYLCTPFSRAAADRLESMNVEAYKIGSGECNNYPLIEHIAKFGKPIILSTGMNDFDSIDIAVGILEQYEVPYALLHCTSIYPTPYDKVRLGAISSMDKRYPNAVIGLSDHTLDNYAALGSVAVGANILERHFTYSKTLEGPDIEVSMDINDLKDLIKGSKAIWEASGGDKEILSEEQVTIDFAYATVVAISDIQAGEAFSYENIWVKRPGTGEILAKEFNNLIGKIADKDIKYDKHINWKDIRND